MFPLQLLVFILPLGLDTFGVSLGLGIKSPLSTSLDEKSAHKKVPPWLLSAILFALAEMLMPLVGLLIGYVASLAVSSVMHYVGALLLLGVGLWEVWEEGREYIGKRRKREEAGSQKAAPLSPEQSAQFQWGRQLLLALSVSLDELAIGFSLGSLASSKTISPVLFCVFIGLQGFLMTLLGLTLGRGLRRRLKPLQEWAELLSAILLIGLGIWFLAS